MVGCTSGLLGGEAGRGGWSSEVCMVAVCFLIGLVWVRLPAKAVLRLRSESSTAAPMGVVFLVEDVDVAAFTCLSRPSPGETLDLVFQFGRWLRFRRRVPSWGHRLGGGFRSEGFVVRGGVRRWCLGVWGCAAVVSRCGLPLFRFSPGFPLINQAVWVFNLFLSNQ
jgi:hypothetical protein